jgi:antitoxin component YwqK of YwqJK toxin-antitoxin module
MDSLIKKRIELLGYDLYRRCSNGDLVSDIELSKRLSEIQRNYPTLTLEKMIDECRFKESDDKFKKSNHASTRLLDKIMEENILPRDIVENILFDYMEPVKKTEYYNFSKTKLKAEYYVVNREKHGPYKEYFENGKLFQSVNYVDDKPDGLLEEYHENGKISKTAIYKNGELHGELKSFNRNGHPIASLIFKNNNFDGVSTFYDNNGNKSTEFLYKNGDAVWEKSYYPNGQLKEERKYKKYLPDKIRAWRQDGTKIKFPRLTKY